MNHLTDAGLALIKNSEGLRLDSYQDPGRVWTIGYGHTFGVGPGQHITIDPGRGFPSRRPG